MASAMTTDLAPDPQTLTQIIGDVFVGMVGQDIDVVSATGADLPMTASVAVSGEWQASVVFACSELLARHVAAKLFGIPAAEVDAPDLRDVIGELVNVIGGNVKSVMPGPSVLSLPLTSLGGEWQPARPAIETTVCLAWNGEPMRISVWSETRDGADSAKEG